MSRARAYIEILFCISCVLGLTGRPALAQSSTEPTETPTSNPFQEFPQTLVQMADTSMYFQPIDQSAEAGMSPLYIPETPASLEVSDHMGYAGDGSAGLMQPSLGGGCTTTCSISTSGTNSGHSSEAGFVNQHTTALVIGTMSAAVSAMLVSQMGKAPSWHSLELLPHLTIGPTGGLYFGAHLAVCLP